MISRYWYESTDHGEVSLIGERNLELILICGKYRGSDDYQFSAWV